MKKINIDDILSYYEKGNSVIGISILLDCSVSTIMRRLKKNNIFLRRAKIVNKENLNKLYKDGENIIDIAKYFNCSVSTIRLRLNEYNIELNTNKVYFLPFVGQKFNRLEFICEDDKKYNKKYWKCKCECGVVKSYDYYGVIKGDVKSCGCYHRDSVKEYNWTGYKDIPGKFWNNVLISSKKRNIPFDITIEYVWSVYEKQNRKCKLSNLPIVFFTKNNKNIKYIASLDRINNDKGYIEGNIQLVVKEINFMKNKMLENDFIAFCKEINDYKKEKIEL